MKLRNTTILSVVLSAVFLLSGCSVRDAAEKLSAAENVADQQIEKAENAVEDALRPGGADSAAPSAKITPEKAKSVALEHAGFTAEQVTALRAELEKDDRIPHYDVQFHQDRFEYEYEIHAETGEILSFEKDD